MRAMVLAKSGTTLLARDVPERDAGPGEIGVRVAACGVCRTDLHVVDGELPNAHLPLIPGHEIVGYVDQLGDGVTRFRVGDRVGVAWLGRACGVCHYCTHDLENLCDNPAFTGYTRDGGYAEHVIADAAFAYPLDIDRSDATLAPLMCAGLIGWRSLVKAGDAERLGLYGFGAAAHIIAQVAIWQGRSIYAFTRPGDLSGQAFARRVGAIWAGGSDELPPEYLDAAIIYAPVGSLVPQALRVIRKGGRVVCAGIHMSDIPAFPYRDLWEERQIVSVANLTREDGNEFLALAARAKIDTSVTTYRLVEANEALSDLRHGKVAGAAVLIP